MGGGKPTVPEDTMDTLILNDCSAAHISDFINIKYIYRELATLAVIYELEKCIWR